MFTVLGVPYDSLILIFDLLFDFTYFPSDLKKRC